MAADDPKVNVFPLGLEDESPKGPPTAVVTHRGIRYVLRFAEGDKEGNGDLHELRLLPAEGTETLEPRALRQFAPQAELYLAYARAAMRWFDPKQPPQKRQSQLYGAANALRQIAGPGRGLSDRFFQAIATEYRALVDEGEPHPVKTIAKGHHVTISAASRWVGEARRRGHLPAKAPKAGE